MTSPRVTGARSHLGTIVAVAVCAYAACDMIHEVLGHGTAAWISPRVEALSLTTVALQTSRASRVVAAAGTFANLVAGVVALWLARRRGRFDATRYFLWLLGAVNLLNAAGYFLFSAILGIGDWAVVMTGLAPEAVWRIGMGIVGAIAYTAVIFVVGGDLASAVVQGGLASEEVPRLITPAYFAGALLLMAGAAMNTISPWLILTSGASTGFGAMAGLLALPAFVERRTRGTTGGGYVAASRAWIVAGVLVAIVFVVVIGHGIPLKPL